MEFAGAAKKNSKECDVKTYHQQEQPRGNRFSARIYSPGFSVRAVGVAGGGVRGSTFNSSCVSAKKSAVAAELRG